MTSESSPELPLAHLAREPVSVDITAGGAGVRGALEAVLFVADEPLSVAALAQAVEATPAEVERVLLGLSREFDQTSRGFELRQVAGGWRLYTRDEFADVVERYVQEGQQARLTQAALETLAIIAYRQPVARSRVAAIRGVGVDGVFRSLVTRGLIEECGSGGAGGAFLYRTTESFLEQLGLDHIDRLPSLAPLLPETSGGQDDSTSI